MPNRTSNLKQIRPTIASAVIHESMSDDERFQNATLRPIIKFQNDLLIAVFKVYIEKRKGVFYELTLPKKVDYITHALQKDTKLRNAIKGMIIGHFTIEEYANYIKNSSALNKRLIGIVKERLISAIQLLNGE